MLQPPLRAGGQFIETGLDEVGLGQSGQGVVVGQVVGPGFGLLAGRQIAEQADVRNGLAGSVLDAVERQPLGKGLAPAVAQPELALPALVRLQTARQARKEGVVLAAAGGGAQWLVPECIEVEPGDGGERGVDRLDAVLGVGDQYGACVGAEQVEFGQRGGRSGSFRAGVGDQPLAVRAIECGDCGGGNKGRGAAAPAPATGIERIW